MKLVRSTPNDGKKGNTMLLDLDTPEGRYAARALAYFIMPVDLERAQRILEKVGREG